MKNKILFLTNSAVSQPLVQWLAERADVTICEEKVSLEHIRKFEPDLIISYSYRHIIKYDVLEAKPGRFINLHISYLPHNKGADPNAWSFINDTPKGVTIHLIDEGLDTGAILLQRYVVFDEQRDTLGSSYDTLQKEIQNLFIENWEGLRDNTIEAKPQEGAGSCHHSREFAAIKQQLMGNDGWDVTIETFRQRYKVLSSGTAR